MEYRSAFLEIDQVLTDEKINRGELNSVGPAHRTNRFLNWVRLTQAPGEEAWRTAPRRTSEDRRLLIQRLGREWANLDSDHTQIPKEYLDWLERVIHTFATKEAIADSSKETLIAGLLALHAFYEQLWFVEGGLKNLPSAFWMANDDNVVKVRGSFTYLLHGPDEFVTRLYECISDPQLKLAYFGKFCALELFGTIKPGLCPPMNGRTAKAMRYLGYAVSGV